jgi:hypothetical protein
MLGLWTGPYPPRKPSSNFSSQDFGTFRLALQQPTNYVAPLIKSMRLTRIRFRLIDEEYTKDNHRTLEPNKRQSKLGKKNRNDVTAMPINTPTKPRLPTVSTNIITTTETNITIAHCKLSTATPIPLMGRRNPELAMVMLISPIANFMFPDSLFLQCNEDHQQAICPEFPLAPIFPILPSGMPPNCITLSFHTSLVCE